MVTCHGTGYAPLLLKLANEQNALIQSICTDTSWVKSLGHGSKPPPGQGADMGGWHNADTVHPQGTANERTTGVWADDWL